MDDLARKAYTELYGKEPGRDLELKYHGKLHGYNATIHQTAFTTTFRLAPAFKPCEDEVKLGVMQYLLNRINKTRIKSEHIDFYHSFVRKMSDYAPVTKSDPALEQSYMRMNERFFGGLMTRPNLVWGGHSTSLLGTYTYATDTIMISRALEDAPELLLDSVMHHEMLHKKHKFSCSGSGRTHSHTAAFRKDEAKYGDVERELHRFLRGQRTYRHKQEIAPSFLQRVMGWR
jgi:hypothetical protein